ncbi:MULTISPECIES: ATP-binding protein [unclassified Sphingomonas]|uniref:ATP-binding response regulator n=1 Tax=unclassified Sphingomonas TaxID=196159 RepID=UPI001F5A0902|nr:MULTISPECIES: ATP-binding protein [unclassified Sphingomonas]
MKQWSRGIVLGIGLLLCAVLPAAGREANQAGNTFEGLVANAKASMLIDAAKAAQWAREARVLAAKSPPGTRDTDMATSFWLEAEADLRIGKTAEAAPLLSKAISLVARQRPSKLSGDILLSLGGLRTANADVAGALRSYQAAYEVFRKTGDVRSRAIAMVTIALLYQEAKDYDSALKYLKESLEIYTGDPQILFAVHNNKGVSLNELGRFRESLSEFEKALEIATALKSPFQQARTYRNMARTQLAEGQIQAADRSIAQGLASARNDEPDSASDHFLVLSAWSARLHGRLDTARRLIERAFATVDQETSTLDLREGHQTAYDIYKDLGDDQQALIHLEALKKLDDQTSKLAASANTALAAARFDFANQALKIEKLRRAQLQRDIDDTKLRAQTQQTIFGGLAIATGIIVGMLVFGLVTIRRSRNEVRAANVDLAETNVALGRALAAKTEFLATTSHEIRTPLNGILGMTQVMLADPGIDPAVRDRIGVVHGAGITMRALVDDILDVAKMETGNLTMEAISFDLRGTLTDVSRLWEDQARARGVTFLLDLDACPAFIVGDAARLRQIAFNLLSNALKFTERGSVTLRAAEDGETLAISVEDSGIGIPADKIDLIFESFRQVDAGTTRKFGGTGLGLTICRNLAQAMGGEISVASVAGEGSTFTVRIPLVRATGPETAVAVADGVGEALVILDRNPITRSMLRAVLEQHGETVLFASSVEDALDRIAKGGVSRAVIDEATIRALPDQAAALRLLGAAEVRSTLLWTSPDDTELARFLSFGIDQVITKPVSGTALRARVFGNETSEKSLNSGLVSQAA